MAELGSGISTSGSGRVAALDGMRGIAVLLVLLFHVQLGPFRGGFVGVTVFFTLSGFLITSRTLIEVASTERFSVREFVVRRVRRLVPASMLCLGGAVVGAIIVGGTQAAAIGGDTLAAVANVANWRFLAKGTSYADLFAGPSPLNHYWSLAIEEQFYVLFPLVVAGILAVPRRRRSVAIVATVAIAAVGSVAAAFATSGDDFYYGTHTRMFELVIGVVLALAISRPSPTTNGVSVLVEPDHRIRRWVIAPLSGASLIAIVLMAVRFENGAIGFAHGGAQYTAFLTAIAIVGLLDRHSPIARITSWRPLAWIGTISYGIYLYHWPLVALMPARLGPFSGTSLAVLQVILSVSMAAASWYLIERRVSIGRLLPSVRSLSGAWASTAVGIAVLAFVLGGGTPNAELPELMANAGAGVNADLPVPTPPPTTAAVVTAPEPAPPSDAPSTTSPAPQPMPTAPTPAVDAPPPSSAPPPPTAAASAPPPAPTAPPGPPLRIAVAGDSTAGVAARALQRYAAKHPQELVVLDLSMAGCTVTRVATIRHFRGEAGQNMASCGTWASVIPSMISQFQPDIAVVFIAMMEQADQQPAPDSPWRSVVEPDWAAHQQREFEELATALGTTGAPGLWADVPYMKFQPRLDWVSDDPSRTDALNMVLRNVDATRPDITMWAYASRYNRPNRTVDTKVRPDGIHLNDRAADQLATDLVPLARMIATASPGGI